mmetsp:Transcript_81034/g.127631  ORF Transcript_81034/g.127631 Transcript_81034/m.127631 type:complete len:175 (-) Transcript_81034:122-646(-)|eukprot:CAMPEP_0169068996 /NCGR_PEP_ID=MMETSP1015-20121227/4331_1 /TAXON_ID=342587 /ORGANISM="Karlodinium micrum, Strain CCMP2283" /LENGTH=174 /DNA_ID=CAMNT_0009127867 /DNA_START=58 /DNA_END=582 /DNA_ORIENTATION=-
MAIWEQLPAKWADMCRAAGTTQFAWAHDGEHRNGTITLHEGGGLSTNWCDGYWKKVENQPDVLEVTFGSSQHMCHLKDSGFIVQEKFLRRTGKANYKDGAPKSTGWIITGEVKRRTATPTSGFKRKLLDDEEIVPAVYEQKDLKFQPFFDAWQKSKQTVMAKVQKRSPVVVEAS